MVKKEDFIEEGLRIYEEVIECASEIVGSDIIASALCKAYREFPRPPGDREAAGLSDDEDAACYCGICNVYNYKAAAALTDARAEEREKAGLNLTFAAEGKGWAAEFDTKIKRDPAKTIEELRDQIAAMEIGRELLPAEWAYVPTEPLLEAINAHIEARVKELEAAGQTARTTLQFALKAAEDIGDTVAQNCITKTINQIDAALLKGAEGEAE